MKRWEIDRGARGGVPTGLAEKMKALERENRELRQAQRDPAQGVGVFCGGGARPPVQAMIGFLDDHRNEYGGEPICRVLPIAPSTYCEHAAQRRDPARMSARAKRDAVLQVEVKRVFDANFGVYGVRQLWWQLLREGLAVARCTVERLMHQMGLKGVIRSRPVRTTIADKAAPCPLVKRAPASHR